MSRVLVALVILVSWSPFGSAQDPSYQLLLTTIDGFGPDRTIASVLDSSDGVELAGWSCGVCQDNDNVDVTAVSPGETTLIVNGGSPPELEVTVLIPDEGWTSIVEIDFSGTNTLPPGSSYQLYVADYSIHGYGTTTLFYCDSLGDPAVITSLVDTDGGVITPSTPLVVVMAAELGPEPFTYLAPSLTVPYPPQTGEATFQASYAIVENPENPGYPTNTQGFSMGAAHDGDLLVITGIQIGDELFAALGFDPPFFFGPNIDPEGGPGFTVGCVYD